MSSWLRLLLVTPDPHVVHTLGAALQALYLLESADGAASGLTALHRGRHDALLLGLDDHDEALLLLQRVRAEPAWRHLPVLVLCGQPDEAFEDRALQLGATDFLTTPYRASVVRARIANVLHLREPQEQQRHADARWIRAVEGAEQGVWDWDLASGEVTLSPQCRVLVGLGADASTAVRFSDWRERIHPDDATAAHRRLERHRRGIASGYESEHRLRCGDGSEVWVHEVGRVVHHDANGEPLRMIGTLTDISRRKDAEAQAQSLTFYDPITDLPNRRKLVELLSQSLEGDLLGRSGATLYLIDLDHFKLINDAHGHDTGDQLLREVALRLRASVARGDIVARMGGDEFAVLLLHEKRSIELAQSVGQSVGERLLRVVGQPYLIDGAQHHCLASIGVVAVDADLAQQAEQLLKWADIALYAAKHAGRGCLRSFDPAMQAAVEARSRLESELREALVDWQFQLVYQLQVGEGDHAIGAEALVRWMHPRRGLIGPSEFIALAEETGLIVPMGRALLERVCLQLCAWSEDPQMSEVTVSFNISAREMGEPDFVDAVIEILQRTGVPVRRLKLELTESALLGDVDDIAARMHRLRAHGVSFSLDDFGTGFSSLSYLKRLPFDQLKIDRSFVRDILEDNVDAHLSRAIVALAASLGLSVVAEGVELAAQGEMLRTFGCSRFQGFLFGEPMSAEAFTEALHTAAARQTVAGALAD
ncbi:putative bifunctional diguanylate cyclase/phosphodiesterase [Sphaerotilus mobilis]|uniref:PAS domain S-box-containing protein/diguanylate cyclase (GGDEF)-like protein n=1 Tax=Sphaerotilus mobilis TaxID=47994 RepID=A0A4Q7LG11_9BURK|nr:EAL domain-containing protein [Sphaerotilus mobilis]RZS53124.1 PAS domain S-box-containing protein/diguanylate cyclase (GGDEF)-like protein [Sphaerotilus mobilis]